MEQFHLELGERGTADRKLLYTVTRRDTYTAISQAVRGDEVPRIWDRLFYSEKVYAPIVGRECEFGPIESDFVLSMLHGLACPVIVCLPPFPVVEANALKDEQMGGVNENIGQIYAAYDNEGFMEWTNRTMHYDYTGTNAGNHAYFSLEDIYGHVTNYLEDRKAREWD